MYQPAMTDEYFVSYYSEVGVTETLDCRCRIGDLSAAEVEVFKQESGIETDPRYVLQRSCDISLDLVKERLQHDDALREFDRKSSPDYRDANLEFQRATMRHLSPPPPHTPPYVEKMISFKHLAEAIRSGRKDDDCSHHSYSAEVNVRNIDEIRVALYEALMMTSNVAEVERWHILSKTKYNNKGWAEIARQVLKQEAKDDKEPKQSEVESEARTIQNRVEAHRKALGIAKNDE